MSTAGQEHPSTQLQQRLNIGLLFAACFIDGADLQLVPASFRALETDLGFRPFQLGQLVMVQSLFTFSLAPFCGSIVDRGIVPRKTLLATSVASWGALTALLGTATQFRVMLGLRALTGVCLASMYPLSQAVLAGQTEPLQRGSAFGWMASAHTLGKAISTFCVASISNTHIGFYGVRLIGWRVAFFVFGAVSLILALIILACLRESPHSHDHPTPISGVLQDTVVDTFNRARTYFRITSFQLIVASGVFGTIPGQALGFLVMFFQYVGFQDHQAAALAMYMQLGLCLGHILGGNLGDLAAWYCKYHGRIVLAQLSLALSFPCIMYLFYHARQYTTSFEQYALVLSCFGFLHGWCLPGVKRPILTEMVRPDDWASLLALDIALEGSSGAIFGAPMVGLLAEHVFHYRPPGRHKHHLTHAVRNRNANALAHGMLWMTLLPGTLCFVFWGLLHCTLPVDLQAMEGDLEETDELTSLVKAEPLYNST